MLCSPEKCVVEACCCGLCSLKTGSIIIGSIQLLMGVISGIQNLYAVIVHINNSKVVAAALLDLVLAIVIIILGLVLIQGARKERPGYLRTWFYITFIMVALELIFGIIGIILGYHWANVLPNLIVIGLCIYFLIVVRSHYLMLQGNLVPTSA